MEVQTQGFWDDMDRAQATMAKKRGLEAKLTGYDECEAMLEEIEIALDMGDDDLIDEASENFDALCEKLKALEIQNLLTEEYDANNAILGVHPGAGGVDAQDWAEMLLRMYMRWAERRGFNVKLLEYQDDTEGGIKSATILVEGENAYGYLRTERGVHRLVRISPYNAAGKRQTSFASVDVTPELDENVKVDIADEDLRIDTYRSSGAGGQHVNKTDSAVRITHIPTGIVVSCQNERSQHQNKEYAMRMLYAKLYALAKQEHKDKISDLKGNYGQIAWANQIRNYFLHPYTLVKDARTGYETSNVKAVLDGDLDGFINAGLAAASKGEL